jgi:hypothetical protein
MLLKTPATRTPLGALKFVALIIKILSCNKKKKCHGLRSKLPQVFYFSLLLIIPQNSQVFSNLSADMMNPDDFPDPERLKPERYVTDNSAFVQLPGKLCKLHNCVGNYATLTIS